MGSCVVCAWCYVLCGCMNGASPVRFLLSLLYMCAFLMKPVCVSVRLHDRNRCVSMNSIV